jgi:5-methylcytosine-specific restriction endonuclease McrA
MNPQPKTRPRKLTKGDRSRAEEALYRKNRARALKRDGNRCRICGGAGWQTHHVERRSHFGPKRVIEKHDVTNLLSACNDCHELFTGNVLKAVSTTDRGTSGPVLVTRWDDTTKDYVTFRDAA